MAVLDFDSLYATRFMEYIKNRKEYDFDIMVFTNLDKLEEFVHVNMLDVLLSGEGFDLAQLPIDHIKAIYVLSEVTGISCVSGFSAVFKYRQIKDIMSEIRSDYYRRRCETDIIRDKVELNIISIYSPYPDAIKYNFAWSYALNICERRKVLFIPLQLFYIPVVPEFNDSAQALSDFIYYLKENNSNSITKMKPLLQFYGTLSYLNGFSHGFDVLSLNKEDIEKWLGELKENTDYETIIFYTGLYSEAVMEIIKQSNEVFLPLTDNAYEKAVIKDWERQMEFIGVKIQQDKFRKIKLSYHQDEQNIYRSLEELKNSQLWSSVLLDE